MTDPNVEFPHDDVRPPRPMFYDRSGQPTDPEKLDAILAGEFGERIVAYTSLVTPAGDRYAISTLFLGIDHAFDGTPLLFETATFDADGALDRARHPDERAARVGHLQALKQLVARVESDSLPDWQTASNDVPNLAPSDLDRAVEAITSRSATFPPNEGTPHGE